MTGELASALVAALADLSVVEKGRTATIPTKQGKEYSYAFADIGDVVKLTRPVLAKHGVVALTPIIEHGDGLACTVILLHSSGDRLDLGPFPFPHGETAQATGSMVTYHRRYALVAALGMAAGDDDDGAAAAPRRRRQVRVEPQEPELITPAWVAEVNDRLDALPNDLRNKFVGKLQQSAGLTTVEYLPDTEAWRQWVERTLTKAEEAVEGSPVGDSPSPTGEQDPGRPFEEVAS